jgi:uncharacterized protein Usg
MNTTSITLLSHRLTTAEILYHMPDYPDLLQSFIWQHLDVAPEYPRLRTFLDYWRDNLDGRLHSVTIGAGKLNSRSEFRHADVALRLH